MRQLTFANRLLRIIGLLRLAILCGVELVHVDSLHTVCNRDGLKPGVGADQINTAGLYSLDTR